jgi:hypothetical protein
VRHLLGLVPFSHSPLALDLNGLRIRSFFPITEMTKSEAIAKVKLIRTVQERLFSIGIRPRHSAGEKVIARFDLEGLTSEVMDGDIVVVWKKTSKRHSGVKLEVIVKGHL